MTVVHGDISRSPFGNELDEEEPIQHGGASVWERLLYEFYIALYHN